MNLKKYYTVGYFYLKKFTKIYFFLILIFITSFIRVALYKKPFTKQNNFTTYITIQSPIVINEKRKVIHSYPYTIKTFDLPFYNNNKSRIEWGDVLKITGDRYYNTIYAKNITYEKSSILKPLYKVKKKLVKQAYLLLPEPHASLLNGMLWGIKPDISEKFNNNLIKSGLIHVVVVSGFNISIIYSLVFIVFNKLSIKKSVLIALIISLIYSLLVGFDPPVLRALLMGGIVGIGKAYGKVKDTLYILLISSGLLIILNPSIIYSVSFQLTFSATLGILALSSNLKNLFSSFSLYNSLPEVIKEDLSASLSAQVFVTPIIIYYFKRVSLISLISNPLILWMVPLIMFIGAVFIVLNLLGFSWLTKILISFLIAPLDFFVFVINFFSEFEVSNIPISINLYTLITLYAFIATLTLFIVRVSTKMKIRKVII